MASLCRKPNSPYFFACILLPDGRRTKRSTKLTDRKKAQKVAEAWEEAGRRRVSEEQAHRVISDVHKIIHGSTLSKATLSEFRTKWLAEKKSTAAPTTYSVYKHAVDEFVAYVGDGASAPLHYVTPAQVIEWRNAAAARATARTANNKLKILRIFFNAAKEAFLTSDNPAEKVGVLKTRDTSRRPFTPAEIKSILRVATAEWRGMVLCGLYLGQRLRDLAGLTWANVDLQEREIRLTAAKTGRRQIIPIAEPLRAYLEEVSASDNPTAPLFPSLHPLATKSNGASMLSQQFHDILVSAGLAKARASKDEASGVGRGGRRIRNDLSFHALRHTATSWLKNAGVSEVVAMDLIGHDSVEISRHYTHVDAESKRAAIGKLPDVTT